MLFLWPGTSTLLRGQGTYLSDEEINQIVDHCSRGEQNFVQELVNMRVKDPEAEEAAQPSALKKRDELYESAVDLVVREGRGSVSLLQRALGIGYGRAARLIDFMAEDGIVGQYNGSQARDILITLADWERMQGLSSGNETTEPSPDVARIAAGAPPRRNIVKPEPWDEEEAGMADEVSDDECSDDEVGDNSSDEDEDAGEYQAESA
jgi:DNA segregation ATPase FtsK/SpoIIIE, S-DNA-T family